MYQVSWVFDEKNRFYCNFSGVDQKALPPPLKSSKKLAWDRVNLLSCLIPIKSEQICHAVRNIRAKTIFKQKRPSCKKK